jgi:chaperonin GroES
MKAELGCFGQRVLVKKLMGEKTAGGIIIPETSKDKSTIGEIVEAGKDCVWVKKGDKVFFSIHSGFEVPIEGYQGVRCMNEEDLLGPAIIKEI